MPPLDGIRVIDLTRVVAGPLCTMMLGDMGADVLKIEEPTHGDDSRAWAPLVEGTGSFFLALNRSKRSVALDLKTAAGAEALNRLIESADVLIENFRPRIAAAGLRCGAAGRSRHHGHDRLSGRRADAGRRRDHRLPRRPLCHTGH